MKTLVREYEFSPEQQNKVKELAARLSLTETVAGLLYARGMDTAEKMEAFLHPSRDHFLSPYLMQGMKEAKDLILRAKEEEWRVAVFGDYDADGIGACAILSRALKEIGIEPYLFVPERTDGYGMSVSALDRIFDEFLPDLVITVDCGISNAEEVEYIKEQGAYVIVTDHHELPERLPDCIVINPKLKDDYPYDNLCGAGVAFKLACALIGEKAYSLLDFAALSTVADSVPLLGENRDIVAEGLKRIENSPRPAFSALLAKASEVTAQTLAFTVAPRINAAGRMGDARTALKMFTSENEEEVRVLAEKLDLYNAERQRCCDELHAQALAQIKEEGAFGNVVMLAAENWNAGFVGIVAARVAEEYARPALLFVRHGDMYKGSARSIENVNIFEALKGCSEHIAEFGGHAQAAGVNVRAEEFGALKEALDRYIGAHYTREDFEQSLPVCALKEDAERVARELRMLEPFGVGNRRPLFEAEAGALAAAPIRPLSPHVAFTAGGVSFLYFGGAAESKLLKSDVKKHIVFELNLSRFKGKEYLKGYVRAAIAEGRQGGEEEAFESILLSAENRPLQAEKRSAAEIDAFLEESIAACAYGLCAVFHDRATLARYPALNGMPVDVFRPSSGSAANILLYAPEAGCDLAAYRDIVYLDAPPAANALTGKARVLVCGELTGYRALLSLDPSRDTLLRIFARIRNSSLEGDTYAELARSAGCTGGEFHQTVFALAVFEELGLVARENGRLRVFRGVKTELTQSALYNAVVRLIGEA